MYYCIQEIYNEEIKMHQLQYKKIAPAQKRQLNFWILSFFVYIDLFVSYKWSHYRITWITESSISLAYS